MKIKFSFYYLFLHLCVISRINENVFLTTNFYCANYYSAQIFMQIFVVLPKVNRHWSQHPLHTWKPCFLNKTPPPHAAVIYCDDLATPRLFLITYLWVIASPSLMMVFGLQEPCCRSWRPTLAWRLGTQGRAILATRSGGRSADYSGVSPKQLLFSPSYTQ